MAYCTTAEAKDQVLVKILSQSGWTEATDFATRIAEGDAVIDAALAAVGYTVPFTTVPALVKQLSVLYARYAVIRDAFKSSAPSEGGAKSWTPYKEQFDDLIKLLQSGGITIPNVAKASGGVQISTGEVKRALTMDEPENLGEEIDESYYDETVTGDPE
jgi:hypothetical protein